MQPRTLKLVAIGLVTLSLVLALAGYRLSQSGNSVAKRNDEAAPSQHQAVIAVREIAAGEVLKSSDLAVIGLPFAIDNTFRDGSSLIGRTVRRNVHKAELLRETVFLSGSALAKETEPGYRALAVKVDETAGAGGFLQPGDRVDVFYAVRAAAETGTHSIARLIVRDVRVLAFGSEVVEQNAKGEASGKRSRSAVLQVAPADASRLLLAETTGVLRLAAIGEREQAMVQEKNSPMNYALQARSDRISLGELSGSAARPRPQQRVEIYQGDQVQFAAAPTSNEEQGRHEL